MLLKPKDNTIQESHPKFMIKLMMKKVVTLCIYLYSTLAYPNKQLDSIDVIIKSLMQCDNSFFFNISDFRQQLDTYMPIKQIDHQQAYIAVKDRIRNNAHYIQFDQPIIYRSLKITGYYDNLLSLNNHGDYLFWGFAFENSLTEIRSELNFVSWKEMEKDSLYTSNMKIHYSDDSIETWHDNPNTMIGVKTIPSQGTAEKLLLLEKTPDMNLLVCSLQGFFPPELLTTIRPDLIRIEH